MVGICLFGGSLLWHDTASKTRVKFIDTTLDHKIFGFLRYANTITSTQSPPEPLVHICSLARQNNVCLLVEEKLDIEHIAHVRDELELLRQSDSFRNDLERESYRLSFFAWKHPEDIQSLTFCASREVEPEPRDQYQYNEFEAIQAKLRCIGYCILHNDLHGGKVLYSYISEAVICPPKQESYYIHCIAAYNVTVCGTPFEVRGSYFAQQQGRIWSCAHAALISCISMMRQDDDSLPTVSEINEIVGIDHYTRKANHGLTIEEMVTVLEKNGCPATGLHISQHTQESLLLAAYHAVELGLPAIITFGSGEHDHAMAVVGHTFDPCLWMSKANSTYFHYGHSSYLSSFQWVDKLIVQDDNFGPYHTVQKSDLLKSIRGVIFPTGDLLPRNIEPSLCEYIVSVVLGGSMTPDSDPPVLSAIRDSMTDTFWIDRLAAAVADHKLVLRVTSVKTTYLLDSISNEYGNSGFFEAIDENYRTQSEYLIVEISIPELYQWNNRRLGEALLIRGKVRDRSDMGELESLLIKSIRLPGALITWKDPRYLSGDVEILQTGDNKWTYHCNIIKNRRLEKERLVS